MIVALCLTIREGLTADSKPLFASTDPNLIAAVGKFLAERLGADVAGRRRTPRPATMTLIRPPKTRVEVRADGRLDDRGDDHGD